MQCDYRNLPGQASTATLSTNVGSIRLYTYLTSWLVFRSSTQWLRALLKLPFKVILIGFTVNWVLFTHLPGLCECIFLLPVLWLANFDSLVMNTSSADDVKTTYYDRLTEWTATGTVVPFKNMNDFLHYQKIADEQCGSGPCSRR
jgi:hypothetical protein